ncbi:hypothetical protein CHS0354_005210 [Potamilus streckersoni]|uniref:Uncharacterized protein n=1 Tax=Potamilus streckersoni TaxID=2493646 RepID=A0AAE0S394_9BIVA|nr:hypothetical protein CHS0354_005210 [Potamilus streckersoni]
MNGELQKEFIPTTINPALRRFKTTPTDDNRLSLATIKAEQVSCNNSNLDEPTSNLHFFGCFRTRRQRNLKTGYRLGHAHETTISSDTDEEMNDLEILDSNDERVESHSESGDADCVEVQTGPVSTLSSEGNMSVNMNDNDSLSHSCRTSDPQYCEKYESKIQTELDPSSRLNISKSNMMTNSLLNSDDQKMCADVPTMDQPSNDDRLDSTLVQMCADVPTMDQPSNDDRLDSTLVQMCADVPTIDQPSNNDTLDSTLVQMCADVPTMDQPSNNDTLDSTLVQMCSDVPTMDQPSNNDTLDSTLVQMCADVPNIDHQSVDDTLDSNPKQGEQEYLRKLRRKKTVIENDNRLAFYDCRIKKDKVFLQSNQNKQMNSESQEARASSTSEPQCKITSQENARTAMESKTSKDLADDQLYETKPELDQEHMAFLAKLRKIKTKCTDDNRLTFFENYTVVQVIPREDNSVPVPVSGRNSSVSKRQRNFVPDSDRQTVKDKANEDKHFITVQNQPASTDSRSKRSTRSENNNKKTTMSIIGKNSDKANHHGPLRSFKSDLQSELAMEDKKSRRSDRNKDTKISERKTPQTSLKSGPSPNVPPATKSSQGTASHEKTSDLDNYEWYFKGINRVESEKILRDKGNSGCFMVRDSSRPGMYSISLFYKARRRRGHVKHYLISKSMDDKFYLEKKQEFTTIPELVDYYKLHVGCLITLLGNPPVRKNDDIVRTSTRFVSDSDDTSLSSEESLLSEDESQGDLLLVGQGDNILNTEDEQLYLEESVWDNVMETEAERCLKLNPLPIGRGRNTVLCIDISASMSGTAWDQMKIALNDFLQGLEENAKEDGPEENVAIITFGHQTRVALTLTNDYIQVKNTLDQLYPDGVSPLTAGMALIMVPLVCIQVTRPIHVDLHRIHVYPRAVFFTDGKATPAGMISGNDECPEKDRDEVHANLVDQCEKIWAEIKVEFVFVPVGDANRTILGTLAKGQNGKIEEYTNMKRLISLSRNMGLACQIGGHMLPGMKSSDNLDSIFFKSLVAAISPKLTSQEVCDMLEIVEKFHKQMKNQEAGSSESSVSEKQDTFEELRRDKLPPLGTRVRRGHNWKGGNYDSLGPGTITGHSKQDDNIVYVQWDNGFKFSYEAGSEVEVIDQPKPSTLVKLSVCVGCMVRRGPHWQWGNVDGEPGALGTVYRVEHDKTVQVRWQKTGNKGNYRCGCDGMFDVIVCNPEDPYESKITEEVLNKRNTETEQEASKHLKVSSIGKRFPKRTEALTKDKKSISWYKEPIIQLSQPTERNSDFEGTQESFLKMNETSSVDQILSVIGEQCYIKSEKLNSCEQNNETTSWKVNKLQDISLEKEKTLSGAVVNESKLAEKSLLPDTHDEIRESNSVETFENAAFFNDLEVNISASETVQENTSWEVKELQDISLLQETTLKDREVNESKLAENFLSSDTHHELGESNLLMKFENTAFFNDLEVNIGTLETIQEPLMESNETSSGDQILSIIGEQSSIKDEKLNPWEQNNENTSWEVKGPQDISLLIDTTLKNRLVNESKFTEKSLSPDTHDEIVEFNSMEKFENAAFFNDLEESIDALETVQEPLMESNETSSGDQILSVMGEQSSIKSEKLDPCEQKNENTSCEVKELQNSSLEKEKILNGEVANERKFAEKSLSHDTHNEELGKFKSLEKLEDAAFFSNFEMNIDALDQEPFMERNETSSGEFDLLEKFEKANFLNNLEGDIIELSGGKDQNRPQINEESKYTKDKTSDMDEENFPALGIEIRNQTDRSIQDISLFEDNLPRKEETVVKEDQIITISPVHILLGEADCLDYSKTNDVCEESYDTDSTIVSEESYSTDESQSSTSSSCADENLDYRDLNMQETSPSLQTVSQIDSVQNWKLKAYFETNQEQTGMQNSSEDGMFSSNLPISSRTMSQESLFTQDSSYDWRGSMSELSDTSLCLGEGEVMPQWVWLNQDNMWEPYSRDMNMKLEKSFRRNPKSTTVVQIGIQLYRVIFSHMVQRNIETKEIFKIQRHEISS